MSRQTPTGKAPDRSARANEWKLKVYSDTDLMGRWPSTAAKTALGQWYRQCATCQGGGPAVDDQNVAVKLRVKHSADCPSITAGNLLWRTIAIWIDMAERIARAEGEPLVSAGHLNGAIDVMAVGYDLVVKGQAEIAGVLFGPQVLQDYCEVCAALERVLIESGADLAALALGRRY